MEIGYIDVRYSDGHIKKKLASSMYPGKIVNLDIYTGDQRVVFNEFSLYNGDCHSMLDFNMSRYVPRPFICAACSFRSISSTFVRVISITILQHIFPGTYIITFKLLTKCHIKDYYLNLKPMVSGIA